ncbi:MAG: hypothetical protein IOC52_05385 [Methylobacterium sp.]|nr:hypothetical protein [Methylobacterium sp.]
MVVRVLWPRGRSYRYEHRFYRDAREAEGGLRWLDKMERQRGVQHCILPAGRMAPWIGDDAQFRVGRSGDIVTMLDDLERAAP